MVKQKTNRYLIWLIIMLCMLVVSIIFIPTTYAEGRATGEFSQKTSLTADLYANGDKKIVASTRIDTYVQVKSSGDGIFMVQGSIFPKLNDGSNDYKVRQFTLDVGLRDNNKSMNSFSYVDNSVSVIKTQNTSAGLTISNNGITFNISTAISMTYDISSVKADYQPLEPVFDEELIHKQINISPIKSQKDQSYKFTTCFFFKFDGAKDNAFLMAAIMKDIYVEGIAFAPDYEVDNSEYLLSNSTFNLAGTHYEGGGIELGTGDKRANDTMKNSEFNHKEF